MKSHQEKLSEVVKAIQIAVPEIMELKMGCEVLYMPDDLIVRVHLVYWSIKALRGTSDKDGTSVRQFPISDCKILGRPITLEDVLRAIRKGNGIANCIGADIDLLRITPSVGPTFDWTLGQPFHLQSEATIAFLYQILISNE